MISKLYLTQLKPGINEDLINVIEKEINRDNLYYRSSDFEVLLKKGVDNNLLFKWVEQNQISDQQWLELYYNIIKQYQTNYRQLLLFVIQKIFALNNKTDMRGELFCNTISNLILNTKVDFESFFELFLQFYSLNYMNSALLYFANNFKNTTEKTITNITYLIIYCKARNITINWQLLDKFIEQLPHEKNCLKKEYFTIRKILPELNKNYFFDKLDNKQWHYNYPRGIESSQLKEIFCVDWPPLLISEKAFCEFLFESDSKSIKKLIYQKIIIQNNFIDYSKLIIVKLLCGYIPNIDLKRTMTIKIMDFNWDFKAITLNDIVFFVRKLGDFNININKIAKMIFSVEKANNFRDCCKLIKRIIENKSLINMSFFVADLKKINTLVDLHDVLLRYNFLIASDDFKLNPINIRQLNNVEFNGHVIVVPEMQSDLVECGVQLNICIGTAGYGDRVSTSLEERIIFLKKMGSNLLFAAIHFELNYKIKEVVIHQAKLKYNEEMDQLLINSLVKKIKSILFFS